MFDLMFLTAPYRQGQVPRIESEIVPLWHSKYPRTVANPFSWPSEQRRLDLSGRMIRCWMSSPPVLPLGDVVNDAETTSFGNVRNIISKYTQAYRTDTQA